MGIIYLPPHRYKCSKCGGQGEKYSRSARPEKAGTYEGVRCNDCGHFVEWYKPSLMEEEMGSAKSYTVNRNEPKPF